MVVKVTASDIVDKVTTGEGAATLINDSKRAINQLVDGKEDALGSPRVNDWVLSSSTDKVRKWVDMSGEAISYKLDNALGSTAWRTSTDTGGADLSGKLEWGYPLGLLNGVTPTVPTITGNTWTHTIEEDVASPLGMTLPAVGYSSLLPQGGYVEFNLSLPSGHADFYVMLYNDRPSLHTAFDEVSKDCIVVTVSTTGISLRSSLEGWTVDVPNTQGVTSFGISVGLASLPRLHVNGVSHTIETGSYAAYFSIATAYVGGIGEQLSVTLDPVSTANLDPAYVASTVTMVDLTTLINPAMYGVPQNPIGSPTLNDTSDNATYQISPRRLNGWFNGKALTQADIDNATSTKGTVSGEQLAALGGGGPEILKDWTSIVGAGEYDLFSGIDVSSLNYDGLIIEIKNLKGGSSRVFSGSDSELYYTTLKFKNSDGTDCDESSSSNTKGYTSDNSGVSSRRYFQLFAVPYLFSSANSEVVIRTTTEDNSVGWFANTFASGLAFKGSRSYKTFTKSENSAGFHNLDNSLPERLILKGVDSQYGYPLETSPKIGFRAEYRIIRKQ